MDLIAIINLAANQGPSINMSISIFFLVFFLYFCLMFYICNLGIEKEKNEKLMTESFISKMNQLQYEQIINSLESLRGIKHDISNHIETLSLLINSKEYERAKEYLNTISSEIAINYKLISTGNIPVDCIISNKYTIANNKSITFDYTIHLPPKMPIDDVSICSLLGNILDNAIESCEKISNTNERFISLSIRPFKNMLLITITNSSIGDYKLNKSGKLLTTKQNKTDNSYHGIGMKQIHRIVKDKKGFIRISPESDSFTLEIMIPLEK
jgi:sensor histidine kinase regulating citrate/malate metabolism